jgi:hypothetical protein
MRFYLFAGLVELAFSAGYVDLAAWEGVPSFALALKQFEAREAATKDATDLTLIRGLLSRLELKQSRVSVLDVRSFFAFASYLNLTGAMRRDEPSREFIEETIRPNRSPARDLPFLVSPAYFAEALATGSIAGIAFPAVRNGLATLRYFQWLAEILARVEHDSDLRDKLIRHARWSRHVLSVDQRMAMWANRMWEWVEPRDQAEDAVLTKAALSALRPSYDDLKRLGLLQAADETKNPISAGSIKPTIDQLISEGRKGGAAQRLRAQAAGIDSVLEEKRSTAEYAEYEASAVNLVSVCEKLAELGLVDAAAVFMARNIDAFAAQFGENNSTTKRAHSLLAQARASGDARAAAIAEPPRAPPGPASSRSQSVTRPTQHRSVGRPSDH